MRAIQPAPRLASPRTATVLAVAVAVVMGMLVLQGGLTGTLTLDKIRAVAALLVMIAVITATGVVVARHQPANPIGWLLLASSLVVALSLAGSGYATYVYRQGHWGMPLVAPLALVLAQQFLDVLIPFPLAILLFPDGRLPSPRWRWVLWSYLAIAATGPVALAAVSIDVAAGHHVTVLSNGYLPQINDPSGDTAFLGPLQLLFLGTVMLFWLCAVGYQIASWRRSSGQRRQQLKWLASGGAVCGILGISAVATSSAIWEVLIVGFAALPVGIAVGILKYRLYEIDRIISRTLAYALITGLLVGVYAGLVLMATRVLSVSSAVAVAAATLAAAALFAPLRRRVQRAVDRRFNRARYDADRTVAAFAAGLQGAVNLDSVRGDLVTTVHRALEPEHVSIWLAGRQP